MHLLSNSVICLSLVQNAPTPSSFSLFSTRVKEDNVHHYGSVSDKADKADLCVIYA